MLTRKAPGQGLDETETTTRSNEDGRHSPSQPHLPRERVFIDNLLVRIHVIIVMIRWIGLAPWEFECPFPGSLISSVRTTWAWRRRRRRRRIEVPRFLDKRLQERRRRSGSGGGSGLQPSTVSWGWTRPRRPPGPMSGDTRLLNPPPNLKRCDFAWPRP